MFKETMNERNTLMQEQRNHKFKENTFSRGKRRRRRGRLYFFCQILFILSIKSISALQTANLLATTTATSGNYQQHVLANFPGVSRELASFCAARPSLPIDLATMIIHVKRNVSFNYKLYLFSADNVFQTGQVIPRDDFRIHSFPVKFKPMNQFWAPTVPTYEFKSSRVDSLAQVSSDTFKLKQFMKPVALNPISLTSKQAAGGELDEELTTRRRIKLVKRGRLARRRQTKSINADERVSMGGEGASVSMPDDAYGRPLPGDKHFSSESPGANEHGAASADENGSSEEENLNKNIQFDRDDQVSSVLRRAVYTEFHDDDYTLQQLPPTAPQSSPPAPPTTSGISDESVVDSSLLRAKKVSQIERKFSGDLIIPVGSFSSFHVNITYFVRKDFDQKEPQIIRTQIDANKFQINNLQIISNGTQEPTTYPNNEDYNFLSHKLLRDLNTRITSINQIYEDWITRNFYTIVYIQRRLDLPDSASGESESVPPSSSSSSSSTGAAAASSTLDGESDEKSNEESSKVEDNNNKQATIVNDRLIFRGTSISLIGADQLDYTVKAAAFITEKNGLHYYLEFLPNGKFYLAAVDWTKRPFKIIDSRRFPIKATKTLLDNEELLLCPPAVCYSNQPIDEVVSYGRLPLSQKVQKETLILSSSFNQPALASAPVAIITNSNSNINNNNNINNIVGFKQPLVSLNETSVIFRKQNATLLMLNSTDLDRDVRDVTTTTAPAITTLLDGQQVSAITSTTSDNISLDNVIEEVKLASAHLQTRLHLRDWVWILPRITNIMSSASSASTKQQSLKGDNKLSQHQHSKGFKLEWRYELARRNDIKVKPDTYGYVLTGHDIDASYRIYNELYLISANHLITINYTKADETAVSTHPIGDEFLGLTSTLLDPITGAFYDRYANQIYFFKGDRYVGYDYASKKPLEDFVLRETTSSGGTTIGDGASNDFMIDLITQDQSMAAAPLVTTLPVVDILGRQHQVDGVYHDLPTDLVFIFSGMKFYSFEATEFKNGTFRQESNKNLPQMKCINEHFLYGCNFDVAFPNPCQNDDESLPNKNGKLELMQDKVTGSSEDKLNQNNDDYYTNLKNKINFNNEQQMKLRSIATRTGLLNFLVENSILNDGPSRSLINATPVGNDYQPQEKIVFYLLTAMVALTVVLIVVIIIILINWVRIKLTKNQNQQQHQQSQASKEIINQSKDSRGHHYMNNQYQHSRRHHNHRSSQMSSYDRTTTKPSSSSRIGSKSSRKHSSNVDNSVL